jgi:Txe/YoeB family toxin of toxin-antitoxin system
LQKGTGLVSWELVFTKQAQKDAKKLARAGLKPKAESLLAILKENPFQTPPPYEKLIGDLSGAYSRRINIQHRLVYQVYETERIIKIIRLWTHYE